MTEPTKFYASWEEFHADTKLLAEKLRGLGKEWKGILSITRGGLVPAGIMASELELKSIETISISSYEDHQRTDLKIIKHPDINLVQDGDGWLVIDDLVDKGETAKEVKNLLPRSTIATVYAKPTGMPHADIFAKELDQNTWIVFPWEIDD